MASAGPLEPPHTFVQNQGYVNENDNPTSTVPDRGAIDHLKYDQDDEDDQDFDDLFEP